MMRNRNARLTDESLPPRYPEGSPEYVSEVLSVAARQIRDALMPLTVELADTFPKTGMAVHNEDKGVVHPYVVDQVPALVLGQDLQSGVLPYTVVLFPEVGLAACPPVTAFDPATHFRVDVPGLEDARYTNELWLSYGQQAAAQLYQLQMSALAGGGEPQAE